MRPVPDNPLPEMPLLGNGDPPTEGCLFRRAPLPASHPYRGPPLSHEPTVGELPLVGVLLAGDILPTRAHGRGASTSEGPSSGGYPLQMTPGGCTPAMGEESRQAPGKRAPR